MILMIAMLVQTSAPSSDIRGDWINQRQTAVIRISDCPTGLCGVVIWSAPAARGDAARGGTTELNGTTVMRDFAGLGGTRWRGQVFLPDLNRSVKATIELQSEGTRLQVKACELGGLVCKTQTWSRWPRG
jgi:uncharacterized protein (DUF2147 family)